MVALVLVLGLLAAGCERSSIDVEGSPDEDSDGRVALLAAVSEFTDGERTPARYAALARDVERLAPRFNAQVAADAERHLVFLALGPLEAVADAEPAERLEALALTVWPAVLEHPVTEEEQRAGDPWAYTERLCAAPLAEQCKQVVPEMRPLVLSQQVWTRLRERMRAVLSTCDGCQDDEQYIALLARVEERERALLAALTEAASRVHPKNWPIAGDHADAWGEVPLLTIEANGGYGLKGLLLRPDGGASVEDRIRALAAARGEITTLGVWMPPGGDVGRLRAVAAHAAAAGFERLALQARVGRYPYPPRAYVLEIGNKSRHGRKRARVGLRDQDSIQLLVSVLEATAAEGKPLPAL
ncbi:hypothetical protein [Haliangium sp.]|uniref:hypothetical protein n=1 Tax=Haliangium sp. TaxID=2663208 RepID=UPI003D0FAEBA